MTEMSRRDILVSETKQKYLSPIKRDLRKEDLRELNGWIDDQQRVAKERCAQDNAEGIHSIDFNPGIAWESVKLLSKGQSAHHKKPKTTVFRRSDGGLAQNDKEQMEVLEDHFQKVFNNKREVKFETLNSVLQGDIMYDQDRDISFKDFGKALDELANNKAVRENGVSLNAIKALNKENCRYM